jgi:colicin import membrane protein
LDQPDTVDQERISRLAREQAEREAQEQEQRQRQEQIELTENIARQQEAERRQRLREQIEAIQREREIAEKRTRMEEQRLRQLTDLQTAQARTAVPANGNRGADQGARGNATDADLRARYIAALNAAVRANWNTAQATERVYCSVSFTQIPGGEVINVEFIDCPYDAQGRDSVERALRKNPMPYSGFESVFWRKPTLTLCYPEEVCQR